MPADNIDSLIEDLDIAVMTPEAFRKERSRLERQFLMIYGLQAAQIGPVIRRGELHHTQLVQDWIDLFALEPYVFPEQKRPPKKRPQAEPQQKGRESGSFYFRRRIRGLWERLYSRGVSGR